MNCARAESTIIPNATMIIPNSLKHFNKHASVSLNPDSQLNRSHMQLFTCLFKSSQQALDFCLIRRLTSDCKPDFEFSFSSFCSPLSLRVLHCQRRGLQGLPEPDQPAWWETLPLLE